MRVRLAKPADHYIGSREGVTDVWHTGEVRELADDVARYLLDTFGERFAAVVEDAPAPAPAPVEAAPEKPPEAPPVAAVVEAPARTTAVPGARPRGR